MSVIEIVILRVKLFSYDTSVDISVLSIISYTVLSQANIFLYGNALLIAYIDLNNR